MCCNMPELGQNWPDAASIGPILSQFWHINIDGILLLGDFNVVRLFWVPGEFHVLLLRPWVQWPGTGWGFGQQLDSCGKGVQCCCTNPLPPSRAATKASQPCGDAVCWLGLNLPEPWNCDFWSHQTRRNPFWDKYATVIHRCNNSSQGLIRHYDAYQMCTYLSDIYVCVSFGDWRFNR